MDALVCDEGGQAMKIWVITDGRAGNENPALGLAEAVGERCAAPPEIAVKRITARPMLGAAPPVLWDWADRLRPGAAFLGLGDAGRDLARPWPALAVGAGRKSAPIIASLGRLSHGAVKTVQIMAPQLPLDRFDLVAAPAHDRLSGPRVFSTTGALHRVTPARLAERDLRLDALPRPLITAMIGGESRSAGVDPVRADRLIDVLAALATGGYGVAVTTSRRTPVAVAEQLQARLGPSGAWVWDGAGRNPIYAMLGGADALIVTADSVNMTSEAAATGRPVFAAVLGRLSPKLTRFQAAMLAGGHIRLLDDLTESLTGGVDQTLDAAQLCRALTRPIDWSPTPLTDKQAVAAAILRLFP